MLCVLGRACPCTSPNADRRTLRPLEPCPRCAQGRAPRAPIAIRPSRRCAAPHVAPVLGAAVLGDLPRLAHRVGHVRDGHGAQYGRGARRHGPDPHRPMHCRRGVGPAPTSPAPASRRHARTHTQKEPNARHQSLSARVFPACSSTPDRAAT
eukprot:3198702-Prymnesium_polylepis.1